MTFTIRILRGAQKQLAAISHPDRLRIIERIRELADQPQPSGCKKLSGRSAWRIRVGDYRVIYEIQEELLIILVVAVGHRKDIYR